MLPSFLLVADSNYLRLPELRNFLNQGPDYAIVFDYLVLFEMFKKNPLSTSRASLLIAAEFKSQIFVIKPTHRWLDIVVASEEDLEKLIDIEATADLRKLCTDLFMVPMPAWVEPYIDARKSEALSYMERLSNEVRDLDGALLEKAQTFSDSQLTEIRTGKSVSEDTRQKITALLHEVTGYFILDYQEPGRTEPLATATAMNMFAFRYALCIVLFYLEWVQQGRTSKGLSKRTNDIIDLQIATVSTFFSGVGSNDTRTHSTAREAVSILAGWGAHLRFSDR